MFLKINLKYENSNKLYIIHIKNLYFFSIQMKALREYFTDPNMQIDVVITISQAAAGLLRWVLAMMNYYGILKIVAPKRNAVMAAEKMLNTAAAELAKIEEEVCK